MGLDGPDPARTHNRDVQNGFGNLLLVAPIRVQTSLPAIPVLQAWGFLTLNYTPEPGVLLLRATAIGVLVLLGRRRARK